MTVPALSPILSMSHLWGSGPSSLLSPQCPGTLSSLTHPKVVEVTSTVPDQAGSPGQSPRCWQAAPCQLAPELPFCLPWNPSSSVGSWMPPSWTCLQFVPAAWGHYKSLITLNIPASTWDVFGHFFRSLASRTYWRPCVIPSTTSSTGHQGLAHMEPPWCHFSFQLCWSGHMLTDPRSSQEDDSLSSRLPVHENSICTTSMVRVLDVAPNSAPH